MSAGVSPTRTATPVREVLAVGVVVVAAAIGIRAAWIPEDWLNHLADAADLLDIPVQEVGRWFSAWSIGDGQVFAGLANDPLGFDMDGFLLDPVYRFLRVGFAWATWAITFYNPGWIPYGMAAIGAASIIGLFAVAVWLRPILGRAAWFLVLNPAVYIAFAGDTAEALGALLLTLALATGSRLATVVLGFTRPTNLVAMTSQWRLALLGVLSALAVTVYALAQFGADSILSRNPFAFPFAGYLAVPSLGSLALAVVALVTALVGLRFRNPSWVLSGLFVLCFGELVVEFPPDAWRSAGMLPVLWAFGPAYTGAGSLSDVEAQWRSRRRAALT